MPDAIAAMIADDLDPETGVSRNLTALEQVGRIIRDDDGTVHLPHFLDSNPSRAQVEADRESRRSRAQKAAAARWHQGGGRSADA